MGKKLWEIAEGPRKIYVFHCPGCGYGHPYTTARSDGGPVWNFNGDLERPTFSPSLLILPPGKRCHLFVVDGQIRFCDDCDHELRGKVVPMEDVY